jgi:hypothetical protein
MLRKAVRRITSPFRSKQIFSDDDYINLAKSQEMLLKMVGTPAPTVESPDMIDEADIRLPRLPFNQRLFYWMRWESVILRMICLKLKQEIFRETMKEGFDWEPAFKAKCGSCGRELQESPKQCIYCQSTNMIAPNPAQKRIWEEWILKANKAEQTLLEICSELEDDLNTADDLYIVCIKEYVVGPQGEITGAKLKEIMRGDPVTFRIVADLTGRRGGKWWVCPQHREASVEEEAGQCGWKDPKTEQVCGLKLHEVHYVETEAGGKTPVKYYIGGEVIHTSKYEPSRLYGISPIYTLWIISRTLILMDRYAHGLFEKGRLKGILGVIGDNPEDIKKWWSETEDRLRADPHYMPLVAISSDENKGRIEFVKLMDSMKDTQASEYKKELRTNIAGVYGVSQIFQADVSTGGGLQNEGLQITVTDRAVEMGQSVYHNKVFPKLCQMLGITDWKPKLRPSREMDEMAELQRMDLKVSTAQKMLELGFDVKFEDEKFIFTGEAKKKEEALGPGQVPGQLPSQQAPKLLPARTREGQPEPENRQGHKECGPGMVSTPDNPRCHPIEWDQTTQKALQDSEDYLKVNCRASTLAKELQEAQDPNHLLFWTMNKVKPVGNARMARRLYFETEKGMEGYFDILGYGVEDYKGQDQPVVYFGREFTKTLEKASKPELQRQIKEAKKKVRQSEIKLHAAAGSFGVTSKEYKLFKKQLEEHRYLLTQLQSELNKAAFQSSLGSYFNAIYNREEEQEEVEKSGDMIAHFSCMAAKMQKAGIEYPKTLKLPGEFRKWVATLPKETRSRIAKMETICSSAGSSKGKHYGDSDYPYPEAVKKAVESGRAVGQETQKIEDRFLDTMEKSLLSDIVSKIKDIMGKGTISKILLLKLITEVLTKAETKMEKLAFNEILRAYQEGKGMVGEDGKLQKSEAAPRFAMKEIFDFSKGDQQALRAIFEKNPFWGSFQNMNQSISDKVKAIIEESYEPVNSARMQATIRDVQAEAKKKSQRMTKQQAETIAYGRIGKFDLAKTIEKLKRTVQDNVYHLERIVRTETTGIAAKGREMAMKERDEAGAYRYDWFGPVDHRTSDICREIQKQVLNRGQGRGLPLEELKTLLKEVGEELNPKWGYREWVPHANCRRVIRRVI